MQRILVVEDDFDIQELLRPYITENALKKEFSHAKSYLTFLFAISTKHSCFF